MMNSRWQANKIGLINFWYYDEQEFPFVKGRMLLRGSNGSGKSVTMQSVVPLLLDGNMSPERLDPFGSRDRKMSSYLLEEDDGREERTGYLYLELKRQNSDTYLTIGMGIRARKERRLTRDENNIFKSKVKAGSDRSVVFACIAVGSRADAFTVVFGTDDQPWRGGRRKQYCLDVCRDHGGSNIVFLRDQFSLC